MTTNCQKTDNNAYELTAVIEGKDWKKAQKKVVDKYRNVNIKGFRKGNVPDAMIRKQLGKEFIHQEAIRDAANGILGAALDEHPEIELIDTPTLDVRSVDDESATLVFICPIAPEAKLGEWKNLGVAKDDVTVTDEEVDEQINRMANQEAEDVLVEDAETPAALGNSVEIDFDCTIEGQPFEKGSAKNQTVVLGDHRFIDGFEEQVVGMKTGETKDITVKFPEDYPDSEPAGKEAVFTVTLNNIYERKTPELNDEFAKRQESWKAETFDELKDKIRKAMEDRKQEDADDKFFTEVIAKASANADADVPEPMINAEIDRLISMQKQQIEANGFNFDQYMKAMNFSEQALRDSLRASAESRVRNAMVLKAIADAENLEVTAEDLENEYNTLAEAYNLSVDELKKVIQEEDLRKDLRLQKASEVLIDAQ